MNNVNNTTKAPQAAQIELVTLNAPVVVSSAPEGTTSDGKPGNKAFLTTAPTLTASGTKKDSAGLDKLFAYLTQVMLIQVSISSDEAKLNGKTTDLSNDMVGLLQQTMKESIDKLNEYKQEQASEASKGWWQKALGAVAAVVLGVVGVLTGQPELIVMSAFMLVMQAGGQEQLDKVLNSLGPVGKIVAEAAIAVGVAILTGGISALSATAEVGEELGAQALEEGASALTETAVNVGADAVEETEATASTAIVDAMKTTTTAAKEAEAKASSAVVKALSKAVDAVKGTPLGNALSHLTKALMMGSFWQDLGARIASDCGANEELASEIGGSIGTVVGLASTYGANKLEAVRNFSGLIDAAQNRGFAKTANCLTKLAEVCKWTGTGVKITGAGFGVAQSVVEFQEANTQDDQAGLRKDTVLYQGVIDILSRICTQMQSGFKTALKDYGDIIQSSDKYLTPYNPNVVMA